MITSVLNASLVFFDINFIGNILNRFSKDLTSVDEMMPFTIHVVLQVLCNIIGIAILIATVNTLLLVPIAILGTVLVILRKYSLKTVRSLKRLDATSKISLYA